MFCLPYAGGGASVFNSWSNSFPDTIELQAVQLPGRESRYNEPKSTDIHETVKALADSIKPYLDRPYALFGYSMGALVAFELMRELRRRGDPLPIQLFVAAMRAPQTPPICPSLADLPNDSFLEEMRYYYDPPQDAWNLPELLEIILPTLRADMNMCDGYIHNLEPPFACPIYAFAGQDDRSSPPAVVREWRQQTTEDFDMDVFDGTHFFINTALHDLQRAVISRLENIVRHL
ncbi:MAG: putative thioesterase [Deltaproteobacteria bacterium]|nr:MAG: putative thioesterase [Deltaproteobacteria bacterium]